MKLTTHNRHRPGFVSYILVLTTASILLVLMLMTYRRAMTGQAAQTKVQLRTDYREKEDAVLRSIVSIVPNRAIRAMQSGSNSSTTVSDPLRWQNIFTEALDQANARTSISSNVKTAMSVTTAKSGNSGDSSLASPSLIFKAISPETGYVSAGINRALTGYPVPLTTANATTTSRDPVYPIISSDKDYGALAQGGVGLPVGSYPDFNLITYPNINFGYATPGSTFVAKRNWWAFTMDVAANDAALTNAVHPGRDFVLSIYEVPSQLPISGPAYMSLGTYANGEKWQNLAINGNVFAGQVDVVNNTPINVLASRRSMSLSSDAVIGGQTFSSGTPFTPGVRESYQLTKGTFFPVSSASESGRVAFIPINRGVDFFDRFSQSTESNTLSPTTWNNYSIGALQCAMQLDITQVTSANNMTPTMARFSYLKGGVRQTVNVSLAALTSNALSPGYVFAANAGSTYNFGSTVVDCAYGGTGKNKQNVVITAYNYKNAKTGNVKFDDPTFGNPLAGLSGVVKKGYYRTRYPFEVTQLAGGKICLAVYPMRIPPFLTAVGADSTAVNNSLVVNVDYTAATGSLWLTKPNIPCTNNDYGLVIKECSDLSAFTKGFSIVSNLRAYIGDDFNVVAGSPPSGYSPPSGTTYYPPCSLFVPEKRYGADMDAFSVSLNGQVGSLANPDKVNVSDSDPTAFRPLDSTTMSGNNLPAAQIYVNLSQITHPAQLPPIYMMNWLVVLEERRKEFINY